MADWFVIQDSGDAGPFSAQQIKQFVAEGRLGPDSLLRKSNVEKPFRARNVKGLAALFAADAPAPQPPVPQPPVLEPAPTPRVAQPPVLEPAVAEVPPSRPDSSAVPELAAVSPVVDPVSVRKNGSKLPWILFGILGFALTGAMGFATARGLTPAPDDEKPEVVEPKEPTEELTKEIKEKKDERDKLDDKVRSLEKKNRELEDKKKSIEVEIRNLTTFLEDLRKWQTVDVAFLNPGQFVVGLKQAAEGVTVAMKDRGKRTLQISRAMTKAGVPVLAGDPAIARRLHQDVEINASLGGEFVSLVNRYYARHNLIPLAPDDAGQWVTFWDSQRNRQEIGIYADADHESLTYVSHRGKKLMVPRKHVLEGTAIKGSYDDVVSGLSEAHFLDYCLLRVAQGLQTPDRLSTHALGVHVVVDGINRSLSESFQDPPLPNPPAVHAERGIAAWVGSGIMLHHYVHAFSRYEQKFAEVVAQRNEARRLETAVAYLEDEVQSKLTDLGVLTYDRSLMMKLAEEFDLEFEKNASVSDFGRDVLLTHALVIEVKSPKRHGDYHLAVRLVDLVESKTVFAENSDRIEETLDDVARRRNGQRQYHLDSGRLALLGQADELRPVEDPVLVGRGKGIGVRKKNLVYVENGSNGKPAFYRPLFGKAREEIPANLLPGVSMVSSPHDIPIHDMVRYITCRTAQRCLPLAGRVIDVKGDRATVTIGQRSGVQRGDSLRVLRYYDSQQKNVSFDDELVVTERRLPVQLNVVDVHDYHCEVVVAKTGFEDIWYSKYELSPGDLAVPARSPKLAIGFVPPLTNPTWNVSFDVTAARRRDLRRNPSKGQRWFDNSVRLSDRFANEIHEGFKGMNVGTRVLGRPRVNWRDVPRGKTSQEQQISRLRESGASHAMVGEVKVKSENWIDVRMTLVPLDGKEGHEPIDSMNFPLKPESLPK